MSLTLIDAREIEDGVRVIFGTDNGVEVLEGTHEEMAMLGEGMAQVALFAQLNEDDTCWITSVPVGHAVVYLGLLPDYNTRMRIVRP